MHLNRTEQVDVGTIASEDFDLALFATGFEQRATHLLNFGAMNRARERYAIGFYDRIDAQRNRNDAAFKAAGCRIIDANGNSGQEMRRIVDGALSRQGSSSLRMLVDYSSMTRPWFAAIIEALRLSAARHCECYFCYSPSVYSPPGEVTANASVGPVQGFSSLESPEKPTALILGLGYERERCLGIKEYVDPAVTFAFYTDPSLDPAFTKDVLHNNRSLLVGLPPENRIRHSISDLQQAGNLLESVCAALKSEFRVILAPMGVKPFALQCLLLASRYPDLDVWRVSSGASSDPQLRPAAGPVLVLKTLFANTDCQY